VASVITAFTGRMTERMKAPMSCAHRLSFHFVFIASFMSHYYVTLRTLLSAPVYGILCTSQGLLHSLYCIYVLSHWL